MIPPDYKALSARFQGFTRARSREEWALSKEIVDALDFAAGLQDEIERLKGIIGAVLQDAQLEDNYEARDSDGRFISKASLLAAQNAFRAPETGAP